MNFDPKIIEDYIKSIEFYSFQDFCDRLLITLFPNDFTPVRAGGRNGDMKNDGYCYSSRIFFQAHATRGESARKSKKKIETDLIGCINNWRDVEKFIYITNDVLIGEVESFVDKLRLEHPDIKIEIWNQKIIVSKLRKLGIEDIEYIIDRKIIAEVSFSNSDLISSKYLITSDFNFIKEITNLNFKNFPFQNPFLLENNVFHFLKKLLKKQKKRDNQIEKSIRTDKNKYHLKYPNAKVLENKTNEYQFFFHERTPFNKEIKKVLGFDNISLFLLQNNIPIDKISLIKTCYENECYGSRNKIREIFLLRPFYVQFLLLKNITNVPVKLNSIELLSKNGVLYNGSQSQNHESINLPNFLIEPSQNIVIPIGLFLSDFDDIDTVNEIEVSSSQTSDKLQILHLRDFTINKEIEYFGPSITPLNININANNTTVKTKVHKFDFNNIYSIDRHWQYGSCPHLFYAKDGQLNYQGEIFNDLPNKTQIEKFTIPDGVTEMIIAELEQEITHIDFIKKNESMIVKNIILNQNEDILIPVKSNDKIILNGKYTIKTEKLRILLPTQKEKLIRKYKITMPKEGTKLII